MAEVVVDTKAIDELGRDLDRAKRALIGRLGERGYQLLREEVPYVTGNLKQGVSTPDVDYEALTATLTAGAGTIASVQFGDGVQHPGVPTNAVIAVTSPGSGPSSITGAQTYTPPAGTSSVTVRITRVAAGKLFVPVLVSDDCGAWRTFVGAGAGLSL